jgi:hypothetical protein
MERRYLAATIAMAATFALFSHAFESGLLNRVHDSRTTLISEMHCAAQSLRARLLDKVNRSLGAGTAEEAQLRVELNLGAPFAAAVPAVPAAPALPAIAASPKTIPAKAPVAPVAACPTQRLVSEIQLPRDFERAQAKAMAMQSRALATQARLMAVQARLTSQAMQREITRAALAQARANVAQARISHSSASLRTLHVRAGAREVDVDLDGLSDRISDEVQRSLESVRTF